RRPGRPAPRPGRAGRRPPPAGAGHGHPPAPPGSGPDAGGAAAAGRALPPRQPVPALLRARRLTVAPDAGGTIQGGVELDFLIRADRAEIVNGKLYLMGGGFDRVALPQFPGQAAFDVALGVVVGYTETNEAHEFELTLEDDDGQLLLGPVTGRFELGRPPGLKPAEPQRFMYAAR